MTPKQRHITNAINFWRDKSNGVNRWYDKTRHPKEYCDDQVLYFSEMLNKK